LIAFLGGVQQTTALIHLFFFRMRSGPSFHAIPFVEFNAIFVCVSGAKSPNYIRISAGLKMPAVMCGFFLSPLSGEKRRAYNRRRFFILTNGRRTHYDHAHL
jgi:hypothetical protein